MITYSQALYRYLEPFLDIFERKIPFRESAFEQQHMKKKRYDVVLFGLGRYGAAIANHLSDEKYKILAIDFNPDEVRRWRDRGFDAMYGDACDQEFVISLPLDKVKWVISAMPQHDLGLTHEDPRLILISALKSQPYKGKIAVSTHHTHDIKTLKSKGADLVLRPFCDAANKAVKRMKELEK
jgi:Trk K+ transport system NAD-binding subunit